MTHQYVVGLMKDFMTRYPNGETAIQELMKVQRKSIPVKKFNETLSTAEVSEQKYQGRLLEDKFTKTEKKERAQLGLRLREKMARKAFAYHTSQKNAEGLVEANIDSKYKKTDLRNTGDRYPEDLMYDHSGTEAAAQENAKITALFVNAYNYARTPEEEKGEENPYEVEFNTLHDKLLRRFEKYERNELNNLLSSDLSDETLVDHFEEIEEAKNFCEQIQNIREAYAKMKIHLPESLERRMNALAPKFRILEKLEQRLGLIDSPYYAEIDPDDPALRDMRGNPVAAEVISYYGKDNPMPPVFNDTADEFSTYLTDAAMAFDSSYYGAENEAIGEMMQKMGAEKGDIMFEIIKADGTRTERPFYRPGSKNTVSMPFDMIPQLNSGEFTSVRVYDRNDPERELQIPKTDGKNFQFGRMLVGGMEMPEPRPPQPVAEPNGAKRWLNSWFGFFQKDVDKYKKYQRETAEYQRRAAAFAREKAELTVQENRFKAKVEEAAQRERQKEERKKLEALQPGKYKEEGLNRMLSVYSNKPRFLNSNTVEKKLYLGMGGRNFSELESIDIGEFRVGGREISEMEFASLAMAGAMQPNSGATKFLRSSEQRENYDEDFLTTAGLTMFTADIAHGRDSSIGNFFDGIKNGRIAAKEALQDYQAGKPGKMADLLANGMIKMQLWLRETGTGTDATDCPMEFFSSMAGLIERDPGLKELVESKVQELNKAYAEKEAEFGEKAKAAYENARKESEKIKTTRASDKDKDFNKAMEEYEITQTAYDHYRGINELGGKKGLTLSRALKTVKAYRKVNELSDQANQARETLRQAALSGQPMAAEKKKECIRAMLRQAAMNVNLELQKTESGDKMINEFYAPRMDLFTKSGKNRPNAEAHLEMGYQFAESRPVEIMQQLSGEDGVKNLDTYADSFLKPGTMEELTNMPEKDLLFECEQGKMKNRMIKEKKEKADEQKLAEARERQRQETKQKEGVVNEAGQGGKGMGHGVG